ncbi:MAG: T9SS type A sorting domain-containing protein [Bacteroidota bacterium]
MKRILPLICSLFLIHPSLNAQDTFNKNFTEEIWNTFDQRWIPYLRNQAAHDASGRYIGAYQEILYNFKLEFLWVLNYQSTYTYHGTSDQIATQEIYSYEPYIGISFTNWRNDHYTEEGLPLFSDVKIRKALEDQTSVPIDSTYTRTTWSYNSDGKPLAIETYNEPWLNGVGEKSVLLTEFYYDGAGCETERVLKRGDPEDPKPFSRARFIRNEKCQLQEEIIDYWTLQDTWIPGSRIVYTYEADRLSESLSFERNYVSNEWEARSKETHEYIGDTTRISNYNWDKSTDDWRTEPQRVSSEVKINGVLRWAEERLSESRNIRIYDANGRELSEVSQLKDQNGKWVDSYVANKEFDTEGRLTKQIRLSEYDDELKLFQKKLLVENIYVEDQVLLEVNTTTVRKDWISSSESYDSTTMTSSVTYDYYCDEHLRSETTVRDGASDIRRRFQVAQSTLAACGIGPDNGLIAYPNPAQDYLTLKLDDTSRQPMEIEILDLQGRSIQTVSIEVGRLLTRIDISDLSPGIYIIRTQKGGEFQEFKFVKVDG